MNIMNLYVYENRSMSNDLSKPLMLENLNVDNVQIHIPKEIDGTDMGTWAWWLVYQNAKREKYSIPMTLEGVTNDEGEEEYISTVGLNHGFTGKHGTVMYAIEAVQADGSGAVTHEWHTRTYKLEIVHTLHGNQTEYSETELDIISALISRVNELITSGAEISEIAETIESAAETAQEVIDSIPPDYSTLSAQVDTNTEDIGGLKADLDDLGPSVEGFGLQLKYNAFDLLDYGNNKADNTYGDLSFTWNEAKTECTVVGSNTANKSSNVLYDLSHLPELLIPGNRYTLTMDSTDSNIQMQIVMRTVSKPSPQTIIYINSTSELYIPDDVTEFGIRLYVKKNTEVNGVVSNIHLLNAQTNDILSKRISDIVGVTKTIITVKSDGSGDYSTLKEAVESITGASAENPYEIDIYPGLYNTLDGYTAEYIAQAESNDFYGVLIPNHVDIKGVGDVHEIILTATLDTSTYVKALRNRISTLNVSGNVAIENITIKATNIRYCVHDAFSANVGRYKRTIKNVIMIASNLTSGNPPRTYGCGIMAPAEDFYFENVDFGGDLVIHSNTVVTETCNAEVVNCRGRVVHISPSGDYYNAHSFVFKRCNFEGYRLAGEDLTLPQNLFITAYGNEKAFIFASPNRIVITGGIEKVVRTNLAVGTMCKINGSTLSATNNKLIYYGVVVYNDDDFTYVQRQGCVNAVMIGLSNLFEGDYITAGQDGVLTGVNATAENAVGVVILNRTEPFIKML